MNKLSFILAAVCFVILITQTSADLVYCNGNYCSSSTFGVYCCGYNSNLCCYYAIYDIWWFWFIWLIFFIAILSCTCASRRRRRMLYRQQAIIQQTPAVVTISSTYPSSANPSYPSPQYSNPQNSPQYPYPQNSPQYSFYGAVQNQQAMTPPPYDSLVKQ